jgi:hypothetical protein
MESLAANAVVPWLLDRYLAQGAAEYFCPTRPVLVVAPLVDLMLAASMFVVAAARPSDRRTSPISAGIPVLSVATAAGQSRQSA